MISVRFLLKGSLWTIGSFGSNQALRFISNIILARLLSPQLFGIMLIVNSFRTGIELLSDVGITQNIVYHKDANNPEFYNTAWTLQAIRSLFLWLVALIMASPLARFYDTPILLYVAPLTAFNIVLIGFSSIALPLAQKRLQLVRVNLFEMIVTGISMIAVTLFAYLSPTIWALIAGSLFASSMTMVGSYFLLSNVHQRPQILTRYAWEIFHYSKWVFVSSALYFLSTNFDRLYLAKNIPLALLGVYGIARSISELFSAVTMRLGNYVLFPLVASHNSAPRSDLHQQLSSLRSRFLLLVCGGFATLLATADLPIKILYDARYQGAAWMLPLLVAGSWFSILSNLNEAILLGLAKPFYSALANAIKLAFLAVGLSIGFSEWGIFGGILAVAFSDLFRYFPILIAQRREKFSFALQDAYLTGLMVATAALLILLRSLLGLGSPFEFLALNGNVFS
jgi:O-antigen/teichoic acid export membrane protein